MNRDDHFCQGGFTSLMREASAKPSRLNSTAANRAYRNPVTTPSKAAYDTTPTADGGSNAPAIVKSTAKPGRKTMRKDVLITPAAKTYSRGFVPGTAEKRTGGNRRIAPRIQPIRTEVTR